MSMSLLQRTISSKAHGYMSTQQDLRSIQITLYAILSDTDQWTFDERLNHLIIGILNWLATSLSAHNHALKAPGDRSNDLCPVFG